MGYKRKTCVRYNTPWHAHALTFSCLGKLPLLGSAAAGLLFIEALDAARSRHSFDLWAYVIMPDHVHLVICPQEQDYSISTILLAIKRPASYRIRQKLGKQSERLWQPGGGYDRNLWKAQTVHKEIDYIHLNPVRRGLCEAPEDWRFSSASFWAGKQDVPIVLDRTLPPREI